MATLAGALDLTVPDNAAEDSFNLMPALLKQTTTPIRPNLVSHSIEGLFTIQEGSWKLIDGLGSGGFSEPKSFMATQGGVRGQLYNLASDPREEHNL